MKNDTFEASMEMTERSPIYLPVALDRPAMRVGIMLVGLDVPAWIAEIVDSINSASFAVISAFIVMANEAPATVPALRRPAQKEEFSHNCAGSILYRFYVHQDARKHPQFFSPFKRKSLHQTAKHVAIIALHRTTQKGLCQFREADIKTIRQLALDVLLVLQSSSATEQALRAEMLDSARYGVWTYHYGDNQRYCGSPGLFWEMYEKNPICGSVLQRLSSDLHASDILYRSYGSTESPIWLSQNRAGIYWKTSSFAIRALRKIYESETSYSSTGTPVAKPAKRARQIPGSRHMLPFLARVTYTALKNRFFERFMTEQWFFAYRRAQKSSSDIPGTAGFIPIIPPKDSFYADPFPFSFKGKDYVFFESLEYRSKRGRISYIGFDRQGNPEAPKPALACDYHLSYPFLFEWGNQVYMIPEASASNAVKLYQAKVFPDEWEFVADLLRGVRAVDSTLFEHHGIWYMFTNISERGGSLNDELFIFTASTPLGPWKPHPHNPVKSDARSARPAGKVFLQNGKLIRPAQDCSVRYGYAIHFCEISALSETDYEERIIGNIGPSWMAGLTGTHTYNKTDSLEVIDGKRWIWK